MTREQAINYLYSSGFSEEQVNTIAKAFDPTTKNDLAVDCISRQAALEQAYAYGNGLEPDGYCVNVEDIQALPSVTPIRPKGHWIMTHDYFTGAYESIDYVRCSCCHEDSLEEGNYCPNCGAEMSGVEE